MVNLVRSALEKDSADTMVGRICGYAEWFGKVWVAENWVR
jgi:hypothetical protein